MHIELRSAYNQAKKIFLKSENLFSGVNEKKNYSRCLKLEPNKAKLNENGPKISKHRN